MSDNEDKNFHNSETHRYWANSVGFVAFCVLLMFGLKTCNDTLQTKDNNDASVNIEQYKSDSVKNLIIESVKQAYKEQTLEQSQREQVKIYRRIVDSLAKNKIIVNDIEIKTSPNTKNKNGK